MCLSSATFDLSRAQRAPQGSFPQPGFQSNLLFPNLIDWKITNSAGCLFWIMMFTRVSILERKFYPDRNVKFEEKIKSSFRINFLPLYTLPSQVPLSLQFVDRGEFVLLLTFIKDINWCNIVANRAEFVQEKLEENIARIAKLPLKWAEKRLL